MFLCEEIVLVSSAHTPGLSGAVRAWGLVGTCTPESRLRSDDGPPPLSPPPLPVPSTEEDKEFIPTVELEEEEFKDDRDEREEVRATAARWMLRPSKDVKGSTKEGGVGGKMELEPTELVYEEVVVHPEEEYGEVVVFPLEVYGVVMVLPGEE